MSFWHYLSPSKKLVESAKWSKRELKIVLIVFVFCIFFAILCWLYLFLRFPEVLKIIRPSQTTPTPTPISESKITITTDKTEYEVGETVRITLRNGLDKSIFGGFGHCGGLPFWGLQKFDNGDWRDLDFSLPYLEKEKEVCDFILCEREEPAELKSGLTIEDLWHLTSICEWPKKPIGVPQTKPKPIEEGTYRVRFIYGLDRREFDLLETNIIYSNEFRIKGRVEIYCEQNSDCGWVLKGNGECFCGNIKYRGLGACVVSDVVCYCNKTTNICEERSTFGGE